MTIGLAEDKIDTYLKSSVKGTLEIRIPRTENILVSLPNVTVALYLAVGVGTSDEQTNMLVSWNEAVYENMIFTSEWRHGYCRN